MKSTQDIAEDLGITVAILRSWQINLNLDHPRYEPEDMVYNSDWQDYFAQVARLRRKGLSFRNIRTELQAKQPVPPAEAPQASPAKPAVSPSYTSPHSQASHNSVSNSTVPVTASSQALVNQNTQPGTPSVQALQNNMHEALLQQDLTKMAQTYVHLMENYQNLAGRFSENTYLLGQLEEKASALETRLKENEQHYREQEAQHASHTQRLESHIETLKQALENSDERFDGAQDHLRKKDADLESHQKNMVTKGEMSDVGQQLQDLQRVIQQQNEMLEAERNLSFFQRLFRRKS